LTPRSSFRDVHLGRKKRGNAHNNKEKAVSTERKWRKGASTIQKSHVRTPPGRSIEYREIAARLVLSCML